MQSGCHFSTCLLAYLGCCSSFAGVAVGPGGIRILSRENCTHLCTCSCQISPSDVGLHLADPFSNAWHETFELDCCRKKMKGLHWGAALWQRHPVTRSMCTRKPQDVYRQKWFSWLLACVLDFQQEMDLEGLAVSVFKPRAIMWSERTLNVLTAF